MSIVKKGLKFILFVALLLGLLLLTLVAPIDKTPLEEQPFYQSMQERMDTITLDSYQSKQSVRVGWSKFSIMPDHPLPLAGYKPREKYNSVHDSLYMRIMAIDNGSITAYLISADLLLFPPLLKDRIMNTLGPTFNDFIYFSATHTHTGVGGWDDSILGSVLMGQYDSTYVNKIAAETVLQIGKVKSSLESGSIHYWESDMPQHIYNRINDTSRVDSKFRGLTFEREDGEQALLFVLGAHPTSISKRLTAVSADYPAAVIDQLAEYDHVQFMAGMVGSQSFMGFGETYEWDLVDSVGKTFTRYIRQANFKTDIPPFIEIRTAHIPIEQGSSQIRLLRDFKLRDWVTRKVYGSIEAELTVLQLGNVVMVGTSCDFAGEVAVVNDLEGYAQAHGLKLIITSFNGLYTGYITADHHYFNEKHEELRILNWVGPYFGAYYSQMVKKVIDKASTK